MDAGVLGIVLAAGAGRRMGGPKALIGPLAREGRTPLARVCSWVHAAGCARVVAVIGAQADAVRAALAADPVLPVLPAEPVLLAEPVEATPGVPSTGSGTESTSGARWLTLAEASDWELGMGASLRTGLAAAAATDAHAALITLVDLPDVRTPTYARVLGAVEGGPGALCRAAFAGRPGHPVVIGRDWWDAVAASAVGDRGAREVFAAHPHQLVECGDLATGEDADTPH